MQRILYIALEYDAPTIFSGNGVASRFYVEGLRAAGHDVYVLCAVPEPGDTAAIDDIANHPAVEIVDYRRKESHWELETTTSNTTTRTCAGDSSMAKQKNEMTTSSAGRVFMWKIPVARECWRFTCRKGTWQAFAEGAMRAVLEEAADADEEESDSSYSDDGSVRLRDFLLAMTSFYHRTFTVDWTGFNALRMMRKAVSLLTLSTSSSTTDSPLFRPNIFMNYRVFCNPTVLVSETDDDFEFYLQKECEAMIGSAKTIALSPFDVKLLRENFTTYQKQQQRGSSSSNTQTSSDAAAEALLEVDIVLPPLRPELLRLANNVEDSELAGLSRTSEIEPRPTQFIACCVRLVPEKNAMLFADLMAGLAENGWLERLGLTPFLCGAAADEAYAVAVKKRLREAVPNAMIIDDFLSPTDLAGYLKNTVLNFHPSLYDAYGMTIVEAAAFGVPSMLHATSSSRPVNVVSETTSVESSEAADSQEASSVSYQCEVGAQELLSFAALESIPVNMATDSHVELQPHSSKSEAGDMSAQEVQAKAPNDGRQEHLATNPRQVQRVAQSVIDFCQQSPGVRASYGERARRKALSWTLNAAIADLMQKI